MPDETRFVNPYTFVPLPSTVVRAKPSWHTGIPDEELFCGSVAVTWTLETPLLLPRAARQEKWVDEDGRVRLPGSSLKGAVRSLHETLFNGCLRIIDDEFVPSYRDSARQAPNRHGWQLAIVLEERSGTPTKFQLCDDELWVDASSLKGQWRAPKPPTSGDVIRLHGETAASSLGRTEMRNVGSVEVLRRAGTSFEGLAPVGGRVVLVTDTSARRLYRRDRSKGRCFWGTGRLTDRIVEVDPATEALADFRAACTGSNDRRELEQVKDGDRSGHRPDEWRSQAEYVDVKWWGPHGERDHVVARRTRASGFLFRGDAVWVHVESGQLTGMSLARIWRHAGRGTVRQRAGAALMPCTDAEQLCLSCATFGAADTEGDDSRRRRQGGKDRRLQSSYGGHVHFSSARTSDPVELTQVDLTPMGRPNPGAGMFYLRAPAAIDPRRSDGDVASHWGSEIDEPLLRLAGRKFYWHHDASAQATVWSARLGRQVDPVYQATQEQRRANRMVRAGALLVPAGTSFSATVSFDRLPRVAVLALLAALCPAPLLRLVPRENTRHRYAVRLGGGKPFGFGSAVPSIPFTRITTIGSRYDGTPPTPSTWTVGADTVLPIAARVGRFTAQLPQTARVLDLDGLGQWAAHVTYPPGTGWDGFGTDDFRHSFEFFQAANGERLRGEVRPWQPLPPSTPDTDPSLPITTRKPRR